MSNCRKLVFEKIKKIFINSFATKIYILIGIVVIPLLINECYKNEWLPYKTVWGASELLVYYGSLLAFFGTFSLGKTTLKQTEELFQQQIELEKVKNKPMLVVNFPKDWRTYCNGKIDFKSEESIELYEFNGFMFIFNELNWVGGLDITKTATSKQNIANSFVVTNVGSGNAVGLKTYIKYKDKEYVMPAYFNLASRETYAVLPTMTTYNMSGTYRLYFEYSDIFGIKYRQWIECKFGDFKVEVDLENQMKNIEIVKGEEEN